LRPGSPCDRHKRPLLTARGGLAAEEAGPAGQTFGLKNKNKSKKVAKYVNELQKQVNPQKKRGPEDDKTAAKVTTAVVAARTPGERMRLLNRRTSPCRRCLSAAPPQKKKEEEEAHKAALAALIKPVQQVQKIAPGVYCSPAI